METPVLFESITEDVIVLDIPTSISSPPSKLLRSSIPPIEPYQLPEPSDPNLTPSPELLSNHERFKPLLEYALSTVRSHGPEICCHPRTTTSAPEGELSYHDDNLSMLLSAGYPPLQLTEPICTFSDISEVYGRTITNSHTIWKTLTLQHPTPSKTFHIPPQSSFLLAPVSPDAPTLADTSYDFILLDPPWPNRSAARNAGHTGYRTESRHDIVPLLKALPISTAAADGALVAVWVTNKPALQRALREEVMPVWGCEVVVEWVWVKVTEIGDPVFNMESRMRKPYEILVLARRQQTKRKRGDEEVVPVDAIPRKVIIGVPDLHSRKPCIKNLVEPFLPTPYKGCEIFGRNLTEGWFTWGDEAIKYNWDGHWVEKKPPERGTKMRLTFS